RRSSHPHHVTFPCSPPSFGRVSLIYSVSFLTMSSLCTGERSGLKHDGHERAGEFIEHINNPHPFAFPFDDDGDDEASSVHIGACSSACRELGDALGHRETIVLLLGATLLALRLNGLGGDGTREDPVGGEGGGGGPGGFRRHDGGRGGVGVNPTNFIAPAAEVRSSSKVHLSTYRTKRIPIDLPWSTRGTDSRISSRRSPGTPGELTGPRGGAWSYVTLEPGDLCVDTY
ncbi:hypothetical protein DFP72DRAFT_1101046, partial [Ephemerocybe angulata]